MNIGDKIAVVDDLMMGIITKIEGNKVFMTSNDGFELSFKKEELVVIKQDQFELSKYSDIKHDDLLIQKKKTPIKKKTPLKTKKDKQPPMEVDLHIHHLTKSTRGMDNYEMLTLQLDTAKRKLEFAIANRIPRIVFIHGIGEGVLKSELEFLFKKYPVDFYAAPFQKYGFGATEVYVYQNKK